MQEAIERRVNLHSVFKASAIPWPWLFQPSQPLPFNFIFPIFVVTNLKAWSLAHSIISRP
jgi:hypothetical protein